MRPPNPTASLIAPEHLSAHGAAARASRQTISESARDPDAQRSDRVRDMAL